jgi:formamidopyrimidine-DNA glycosylase
MRMPELPDVEVFRRYLRKRAMRRRVDDVAVRGQRVHQASASTLRRRLCGRRIASSRRHGKLLFVGLDDSAGALVLHFGMTGFLRWYTDDRDEPEHAKLVLSLDDGHKLAYDNQRTFGRVDLADDPDAYVAERGLGPDALSLDEAEFVERLYAHEGGIKATLMNQKVVAGIGNIYSDEILFHARVHPQTRVEDLSRATLRRLYRTTERVLERAIDAHVDVRRMPRTWLLPHREQGARCPRCRAKLQRKTIAGRASWLCPRCQKL